MSAGGRAWDEQYHDRGNRGYISAIAIQIGAKQLEAIMNIDNTTETGWARISYLWDHISYVDGTCTRDP